MRRALTSWLTAVALAALSTLASAQSRTHVHDVRVGAHEGYERVVVELDGAADIAWERGPEPREETFYLDADLGRRERVIPTKLADVGTITLRAMRVGTTLSLEARERRVRAYLLAKPTRLVIDVAPPGPEAFEVPAGLTALAPATSVGSLKNAPVPAPEAQPEKAEPEEAPPEDVQPEEVAPEGPPPSPAKVTPEKRAEPVEGAVEAPSEPPSDNDADANAPEPTPPAEEAVPENPAPETAQPEPAEPEAAPEPVVAATPPAPIPTAEPPRAPTPEPGFPWLLSLAAIAAVGAVGGLGVALGRARAKPAPEVTRRRAPATPTGVDSISLEELRDASDPASRIEQRLDDEVRARVALEERLAQAGEELKVLRDRLHRVERKRDEAH